MDPNELLVAEKQVKEQLVTTETLLKETQEGQEQVAQLTKVGQKFFQDILGLLQGSSDSHIFHGLYDEQVSLDKKIRLDFVRDYDELQHTHHHLKTRLEELAATRRQLEREETNGC